MNEESKGRKEELLRRVKRAWKKDKIELKRVYKDLHFQETNPTPNPNPNPNWVYKRSPFPGNSGRVSIYS